MRHLYPIVVLSRVINNHPMLLAILHISTPRPHETPTSQTPPNEAFSPFGVLGLRIQLAVQPLSHWRIPLICVKAIIPSMCRARAVTAAVAIPRCSYH